MATVEHHHGAYLITGTLPDRREFEVAFGAHVSRGRTLAFRGPHVGTCALTSNDLWTFLEMALQDWNDGDESAGEWISSVLSVLGWEWRREG